MAPYIVLTTLATVVVIAGIFIGSTALMGTLGVRTDTRLSALLAGFLIAMFLGLVVFLMVLMSGGASWLVGSAAERWTDQELARLGPAWRRIHSIVFEEGRGDDRWEVDIDHVAVGPYGVLVIESKYRSSELDLGASRLPKIVREAVSQAADNAGRIRALLQRDFPDAPVRPVVVFWGRLVKPPEKPVRLIEDVRVVAGSDAQRWRPLLESVEAIAADEVDRVAAKVERFAEARPSVE